VIVPVARGFIPDRLHSSREISQHGASITRYLGPLRSPSGINPLATKSAARSKDRSLQQVHAGAAEGCDLLIFYSGRLGFQRPAQRHQQFHNLLRIQSLRHFCVHVVFLVMVWPGESGQKLFVLGGLSCKKDPSYSAGENSLLIPSRQTRKIVFWVISICFIGI
jgi:hypothetical protein